MSEDLIEQLWECHRNSPLGRYKEAATELEALRFQLASAKQQNIEWARGNLVNLREKSTMERRALEAEAALASARKTLEWIANQDSRSGARVSDLALVASNAVALSPSEPVEGR